MSLVLPFAGACGGSSPGVVVAAVRFDPCHPLALVVGADTSTDRAAGVRAAADLWNGAARALLSVGEVPAAPAVDGAGAPPAAPAVDGSSVVSAAPAVDGSGAAPSTLPVRFMPAAAFSHGYYDPSGEVLINDDLTARPLVVTIAHEVGHAFGLVHVTDRPSVMNPGNLDIEPNAGDVAALAALWGTCGGSN